MASTWSHSARSAWIETNTMKENEIEVWGRTPQGVRGLKLPWDIKPALAGLSHSARSAWIETFSKTQGLTIVSVALRKECVD